MVFIATALTGFSIVAAVILLIAYLFFLDSMQKTVIGKAACATLLITLALLQYQHFRFLDTGVPLLETRSYVLLLMLAPTSFYFFSREILLGGAGVRPWHVGNLLPLPAAAILPVDVAAPLAFVAGAGYTLWFLRLVYGMRRNVSRFRFELFFFGLFTLLALLTLALIFLIPMTGPRAFYAAYTLCIGLGFALVVAALIVFPELLTDIAETARLSYATTTLGGVDVADRLRALERVMQDERLFANEDLNLAMTASAIELTPHQLSELVNTHFGHGFSRYVRGQRVAEAQRLLAEDPGASVLSIGMMVGFRSQSNFYTAFREIAGQTPGAYRRGHDASKPS